MSYLNNQIEKAAHKVQLVIVGNKTYQELYDMYAPCLDEKATLRRVSLFALSSGRIELNQEQKDIALEIIRDRFDSSFEYMM